MKRSRRRNCRLPLSAQGRPRATLCGSSEFTPRPQDSEFRPEAPPSLPANRASRFPSCGNAVASKVRVHLEIRRARCSQGRTSPPVGRALPVPHGCTARPLTRSASSAGRSKKVRASNLDCLLPFTSGSNVDASIAAPQDCQRQSDTKGRQGLRAKRVWQQPRNRP